MNLLAILWKQFTKNQLHFPCEVWVYQQELIINIFIINHLVQSLFNQLATRIDVQKMTKSLFLLLVYLDEGILYCLILILNSL